MTPSEEFVKQSTALEDLQTLGRQIEMANSGVKTSLEEDLDNWRREDAQLSEQKILESEEARVNDLIEEYLVLIRDDHHKSSDGYFSIRLEWDGYADVVVRKWMAVHEGYTNEFYGERRDSYEEALRDLTHFLRKIIQEHKEARRDTDGWVL